MIVRLLLVPAGFAAAMACGAAPASPELGRSAYQKCYSCHALAAGENLPSGPTLHGIVGKPIAAEPGVDYSPALRGFAVRNGHWSPALLDRFVADPEALVPGTYMAFHGIADAGERAALIAWLEGRQQE